MRAKLAAHPDDWDAIDNLAVALEKLDERDAAIAVLLDKERRRPGQYTTAADLGTVYLHRGDLAAGIDWLHKALAINANAHFGREEYQVRLSEFLVRAEVMPEIRDDDFLRLRHYDPYTAATTAPATGPSDARQPTDETFLYDLSPRRLETYGLKPNVVDGLVGMVRFGTGTSPDLYFALGDVLAARGDKNLAVRAYQRALDYGHPRPEAVRHAMTEVSEMQVPKGGLDPAVVAAERVAAGKWVTEYQRFEDDLIRTGRDTEDEANYAPFYATHARLLTTPDEFTSDVTVESVMRKPAHAWAALAVAFVGGVAGLFGLRSLGRRARRLLRRDPRHVPGILPMSPT